MKKRIFLIILLLICFINCAYADDNTMEIQFSEEFEDLEFEDEYSNTLLSIDEYENDISAEDSVDIAPKISENDISAEDSVDIAPKIYVNASKETDGNGSNWNDAIPGSDSWLDAYITKFGYNKINNGSIYLADGNYTQNGLIGWCSCTFIGQGNDTVISFFGDGGQDHKYKSTFINMTFIKCQGEDAYLSSKFDFINCTFIDFPIILGISQKDPREGISTVYNIHFENCEFLNYNQSTPIIGYESGNASFYNCSFNNITSDSIIYTCAGIPDSKGNSGGVYIYNSTFYNCSMNGIVKATKKEYCVISNCNYDFIVSEENSSNAPYYINSTDKNEVPLINTVISINESENGIIIYLTDDENNPIEDEVAIVINNKLFYKYTDSDGKIVLDNLIGFYSIEVDYIGINNYASSNASANFTFEKLNNEMENSTINPIKQNSTVVKKQVSKIASKIIAKKATFKKSKKVKKYKITLKNSKNKVIGKVKVYLKVKNKTYKATTNSKGVAFFKITKLTKKGTFKAKITFKGNSLYKATSKSIKIKVK